MKYDKKYILDIISSGMRPKYIFFWGHRSRADGKITKACFSQWWPSTFTVGGEQYFSAEHWMMAEKARLFGDEEIRQKILKVSKPGAAKALGRQVKNFDHSLWNSSKFDIVVHGNVHKFSQNTELGNFLLGTGNRILVEASPVDPIWGIGLSADDINVSEPSQWKGENLLGFALMVARDALSTSM